jgi:hypothetical protein
MIHINHCDDYHHILYQSHVTGLAAVFPKTEGSEHTKTAFSNPSDIVFFLTL